MALSVNKGDIFTYTWGWEQTNVEFYEVVSVTKTGKTASLRRVESNLVSDDREGFVSMTGKVTPIIGNWKNDEVFKKRVAEYDNEVYMKMDHGSLRPWNGEPKGVSFYA